MRTKVRTKYQDPKPIKIIHYKNNVELRFYNTHKIWYKNNKRHRDGDKPAVIWTDGDKEWYINGRRHRDGDKPAMVYRTGNSWYKHGKVHRINAPAIISDSYQCWYYYNDRSNTEREYQKLMYEKGHIDKVTYTLKLLD